MNDINELVSHGIPEATTVKMLEDYKKRIGTMNGVYKIIDINYDFNERGKNITLQCSRCGKIIHRVMIKGKNKWDELIKTCKDCEDHKRKDCLKKSEKQKKEEILSYIGKTYGDYTIAGIKYGKPDKLIGKCRICGYEKEISYCCIKNGYWKDNKCHKHYVQPIKYDKSYIGNRYGRLTVIEIKDKCKSKFKCRCDCGNIYYARPIDLENGSIKSCGCLQKEINKNSVSGERLYCVWNGMRNRCYNPNNKRYESYGGRSIKICEEWLNNYLKFKDWAYSTGYDENAERGECTIDRIDVNGDYEPSNCRWITIQEQQKNKRPSSEWKKRNIVRKKRTAFVIFNGERISKFELCKKFGISMETFNYRVNKKGIPIEEALKMPKMCNGRPKIKV